MSRSIDNSFYRSKQWIACRDAYMIKVNHLCERCKAKGIYEPARVVHHKIELTEANYRDPAISLNFDNLQALCQSCHNEIHHRQERRYKIDSDGNLIF